jgi:hypothetical protein
MYRYSIVLDDTPHKKYWIIRDNLTKQFLGLHFDSKEKAEAKVKELSMAKKSSNNKLDEIMKVIGTPEQNREVLVKSLFLDMKMTCKSCNLTYKDGADLEQLAITRYCDVDNPDAMTVDLTCHCGHSGMYTFRPNPLIMSRRGAF